MKMDTLHARSRRWVGLLGVAGVLAVGLLGCARQTAASAPDRASAAPTRTFDRAHIAAGPARAEIGQRYPFDLYVHCTGEYTVFAGIAWRTDTPPGDVKPSPDSKGLITYTGYLSGWMTQTGSDTAVFEGPTGAVEYREVSSAPLCA
jgi:hypothetical protein